MTNADTKSPARLALCMAFYTFLLALGAALPLAASYSDSIQSRGEGAHIQGGAYQPRQQVVANAEDEQAQAERPNAVERCVEQERSEAVAGPAAACDAAPALHHTESRGS